MDLKSVKGFFRPTKAKIIKWGLILALSLILIYRYTQYTSFRSLAPIPETGYTLYLFLPEIIFLGLMGLLSFINFSFVPSLFGWILFLLFSLITSWATITLIYFIYQYSSKYKNNLLKRVLILMIILSLFIPVPLELDSKYPPEVYSKFRFEEKCEFYCKDTNSLDYCRYYFEGGVEGTDWDGDKKKNECVPVGGFITWDACEDRIYCFHVVPCERFSKNPIKGCADALCPAYLYKYNGNVTKADENIREWIQSGSCNLPTEIDSNWHKRYFPENVCENVTPSRYN